MKRNIIRIEGKTVIVTTLPNGNYTGNELGNGIWMTEWEIAEKKNEDETVHTTHPDTTIQTRNPETERQQTGDFVSDHIIIGRPGLQMNDDNRPKGMKL